MPQAYSLGKYHIPTCPIPISWFNEEYTTTKYRLSRRSLKAQASPKNRISASPRTLRCPLYTSYNPTSAQARYVLVSVRLRDHLYDGYLGDRVANPRYTFRLYPSPTSADSFSTTPTMCYRKLYLDKYKCTHSVFKQEQKIDCERPNCLLSAKHPTSCPGGPLCRCQRYQDQPARYFREMSTVCPKCSGGS